MCRLFHLDHLFLFHDPMAVSREMDDDFVTEQRSNLFDRDLFRLGTVEVHDERRDDAQTHV